MLKLFALSENSFNTGFNEYEELIFIAPSLADNMIKLTVD